MFRFEETKILNWTKMRVWCEARHIGADFKFVFPVFGIHVFVYLSYNIIKSGTNCDSSHPRQIFMCRKTEPLASAIIFIIRNLYHFSEAGNHCFWSRYITRLGTRVAFISRPARWVALISGSKPLDWLVSSMFKAC
jgi:hypothetical protein